jgi:hypothetical protein
MPASRPTLSPRERWSSSDECEGAFEPYDAMNGTMPPVRVPTNARPWMRSPKLWASSQGLQAYQGIGKANRLTIPGWDLSPLQLFQYGDLRLEGPRAPAE